MDNKITCYPVLIATLNRYEHFVRCITSLQKNKLARETELVIGLDYPPSEKYVEGYKKIKQYLPTIDGFGQVTILERKTNFGPVNNFEDLRKYAYEHYDALIVSEDDNEFSPNFLDFMNQALNDYKEDENISTVSGYNYPYLYNQNGKTAYLRSVCVAFGAGQWKCKSQKNFIKDKEYYLSTLSSWKQSAIIYLASLAELRMLIKMVNKGVFWGDVCRTVNNIKENKYQLAPAVSLVRNHGYDGSGEHCGVDEIYSRQEIDDSVSFSFNGLNSPRTLRNRWYSFVCMQSGKPIDTLKSMIWTLIEYIKYRRENGKK